MSNKIEKYYIGEDLMFAEGHDLRVVPLDTILELANTDVESVFFVEGKENLTAIRTWNNKGTVHFGLRNNRLTLNQLESLPYLMIGNKVRIYVSYYESSKAEKRDVFLLCDDLTSKIEFPDTHIISVTDEKQCLDWIKYFASHEDMLGIDFEAAGNNRGFPNIKNFLPLGMAISDKKQAVYFDFGNYDKTKYLKVYTHLMEFVKRNAWRLYAFYCVYEMGALWHITDNLSAASKGVVIDIQDTMAWCRVDGSLESLKFNAQKYLAMPSWDTEVEEFIKTIDPFFKAYPTLLELQANQDDYQKVLTLLKTSGSTVERLEEFYGSAWAMVPVETMGYYCCLDAFVDILLVEAIRPKHAKRVERLNAESKAKAQNYNRKKMRENVLDLTDEFLNNMHFNNPQFLKLYNNFIDENENQVNIDDAYIMQLQSLHLKARMDMSGIIPVNAKLILQMKDYYETLMHNAHLLACYQMSKLEFKFVKSNYDKLVKNYERNLTLEDYVNNYPAKKEFFFMYKSKTARVKAFIMPFMKKGKLDMERVYYYLSNRGESFNDDVKFEIDEVFTKVKQWEGKGRLPMGAKAANAVYDYIDNCMGLQRSLDSLIETYNRMFKDQLKEHNLYVMKQYSMGDKILSPDILIQCAVDKKFPRAIFPKTKLVNDARTYYVEGAKYDVLPNHINFTILNSILNYSNLKQFLVKFKNHISTRTLLSQPTKECDTFIRYDFNSSPNNLSYGKWLKSMYLKDVKDAVQFVSVYKEFSSGNFVEHQCTQEVYDRIVASFNGKYPGNDLVVNLNTKPWTPVRLHADLCEKQIAVAAKCFKDNKPVVINKSSLLTEIDNTPNLPIFELDALIKCIRLYKRTHHALSNTYNSIKNNTYEIEADWTNPHFKFYRDAQPAEITPESKNLFFVPPMSEKGTRTGRFSGGIQTIGDVDMKMALKVMWGMIVCSKDISAAEPRTIAKFARDMELYKLYNTPGADGYRNMAMACRPYLKDASPEVIKENRNEFKANFLAVVYGAAADALSRRARISLKKAKEVIKMLFDTYPDMRIWMDECVAYATRYRQVKTFFGEIVPLTAKSNPKTVGVNSVIQSTAAKILNEGYVAVAKIFNEFNIYFRSMLQIHDAFYEEIAMEDLFKFTLIFDEGFYKKIRKKYDLNYEYEMELRYNYKDKIKFEFKYDENHENIDFSLEGFSHQLDYVLKMLGKKHEIKILKSGSKDYVCSDKIEDFFAGKENRGHDFFTHDMITDIPLKKRKIQCTAKVNMQEFAELVSKVAV